MERGLRQPNFSYCGRDVLVTVARLRPLSTPRLFLGNVAANFPPLASVDSIPSPLLRTHTITLTHCFTPVRSSPLHSTSLVSAGQHYRLLRAPQTVREEILLQSAAMAAASSVVMQPLATPTLLSSGIVPDAVSDVAMVSFLRRCLLDTSMPVTLRWRAILSLRNRKGAGSRQALCAALSDESSLLAHEAAFSLGQMQDPESIPALRTTLKGIKEFHPIVRHEAAEALGAIGTSECLELLQEALVNDPAPEVRETCDLALHRIEQVQAEDLEESPFCTVDPAVAASSSSSVAEMRKKLLDEKEQLHERYAALFGLRNRGGTEAIVAIIASLQCESALLKHEVAYVLGQLQDKASTVALVSTLKDVTEHPMVRHEAAEALGAIADERSVELLRVFSSDSQPIVAQSCEVALHMLELEQQGKPFELRLDTDA